MSKRNLPKRAGGSKKKRQRKIAFRIPVVNKTTGQRIKVTVFVPESTCGGAPDPRPEMKARAQKCWACISQDKQARQIVQELLNKGCDWVQLLAHIESYCHHPNSIQFNKAAARFWRKVNKRILKFDSKVAKWESSVEKVNSELEDLLNVELSPHSPEFDAYRGALQVCRTMATPMARRRNTQHESVLYLYHLLVVSTGGPRFDTVADLIQKRLNLSDPSSRKTVDAQNLYAVVRTFKKANPRLYTSFRAGVKFGMQHIPQSWHKMPVAPQS